MKTLLIDDVKGARKALFHDLIDYCEGVEVLGEAGSVGSAIALIKQKKPDLIFLDIDLGDGTGFDVIKGLNEEELPQVIFTTAFDHYAIKAFKYGALDYLLKPVDEEELQAAVEKAKKQLLTTTKEVVELIDPITAEETGSPNKVVIHSQEELVIIEIDEIVCCEASNNYTVFHLTNNRQVVSSETLKHYDGLFGEHSFFRTHHSHLVNLSFVKSFVKIDGGYLLLKNGKQLPVSVRKKELLNKVLKERFLN